MAKVLFSRGLSTVYTGLAEKQADTIYFLTDTQQIYLGEQLIADTTKLNVQFVDAVPEFDTAKEDVLYVVTGADGGIYIKGDSAMDQVSGGEAESVKDGVLDLGNFQAGVVATEIGESPTDTTIPTSQAVKEYVDSAVGTVSGALSTLEGVVDGTVASITVPEDAQPEAGTVLRVTKVDGTHTDITIADIFLSAASYDSGTHILTLTLNDEEQSTVTVNLEDLIGNSLSDVTVGADETFTVELGEGGTLGGYKTGDSISADTSIETIIKKLLMKQVPPTYTQPSISITNNGGSASGSYEIGTEVTPNVRATFTQNDAGALTNIQFKKGGSNVGEAQTSSPATYTEAEFTLETATSFSATATYAEGAIKDDNLGEPYEEGHIAAGSKTSSNFTFTPYRQGYFYGVLETSSTDAPLDSAIIRSGTAKNGAYSAGNLPLISASSVTSPKRIFVACPATNKGVTKVVMPSAMNADATSDFVKQPSPTDVKGANGYTAISYNVWVYEPASISSDQTFTVTLG